MNPQLLDKPARQPTEEKLVTLYGITWEKFKAIEAQLNDNRDVKLSYLSGVLEIRSPIGEEHEDIKSTLGLLLEAYMREKRIRFYKRGGFTLESPGYASGTPDDSYSIGSKKDVPDIVIEIIVTSGTITIRELFKPMKVPEIWFWKSNQLKVFRLKEGDYEEVSRSTFFPDLDLALLLRYLGQPDQYDAVQEFEAVIRGEGG
ncbi:Uma2 family endonuclease [Microcoleus sp. FACHB-53]|nr:Uma2 family endonuclease [Microcoleus sp. FACHB-53]